MSALTGTGALIRHNLRRERLSASSWIGLCVLMVVGTGKRYGETFPTAAARQSFAEFVRGNALLTGFGGQLPASTLAGLAAWKIADVLYTLIGLMTVLMVVRHTRAEEESGRHELVAAGVVGRCAPLTASLVVACGASVLTGLLSALGWIALGFDAVGCLALGGAIAAAGCVFAAIGALAAQLGSNARTANGLGMAVLGLGYTIRFVADGTGRLGMRWLSPQGWSHLVEPFGGNHLGVLALPLTVTVVLAGAALAQAARRDMGAGIVQPRAGRAETRGLRGPFSLAWHLHRGMVMGWAVSFALIGGLIGGIASSIRQVGGQSPWGQELLKRYSSGSEASFVDVVLWVTLLSLGYTVTLYPVLATGRLRAEEESGRAELVLSTATSRVRWMMSHLVVILLGTVVVLAATGLVLGLAHGLQTGQVAVQIPRMLGAALIQLPAVWVVAGVAVFAVGVVPRWSAAISWAAFMFVNVFGEILGPIFRLDYWVADLAIPFHHLPKILTGGPLTVTPILVLTGLAALLMGTGVAGLRRRDLG